MKRILIIILSIWVATVSASAQSRPRTAGVRIGSGLALTYQHLLSESRFVTADLDLPWAQFKGAGIAVSYDFLNPFGAIIPWQNYGSWNWYLGVGASVGFSGNSERVTEGEITFTRTMSSSAFGVLARAGVEYEFEFPLTLALEYRPSFGPDFSSTYVKYKQVDEQHQNTSSSTTTFYQDGLYNIALVARFRF